MRDLLKENDVKSIKYPNVSVGQKVRDGFNDEYEIIKIEPKSLGSDDAKYIYLNGINHSTPEMKFPDDFESGKKLFVGNFWQFFKKLR